MQRQRKLFVPNQEACGKCRAVLLLEPRLAAVLTLCYKSSPFSMLWTLSALSLDLLTHYLEHQSLTQQENV